MSILTPAHKAEQACANNPDNESQDEINEIETERGENVTAPSNEAVEKAENRARSNDNQEEGAGEDSERQ